MSTDLKPIKSKHRNEILVTQFALGNAALPDLGLQLTQINELAEWNYIQISSADVPTICRRLRDWAKRVKKDSPSPPSPLRETPSA